ncbi:MAG: metallophosphoesterase [Kiritimatiellae bacterium]|nr:metallophosphoesterase [Kiritimatiellia bacterium]
MTSSRRQFLQIAGGGFSAAWAMFQTRLLAQTIAPQPPLRLGVVSDIHIRNNGKTANDYTGGTTGTFRAALEYFRDRHVDAVVIAGDMADTGQVSELERVGEVWRDVFPDCKGADGARVEPVFVYGNHDRLAWRWGLRGDAAKNPEKLRAAKEKGIGPREAEAWKRAFGWEWKPVYSVKIKGFTFLCAHWGYEKDIPAYATAHAAELDIHASKPFFCVQHPHPKGTLFSYWGKGAEDGGELTEFLKDYPNAVSFSGHSHMGLTDDRSVWQGAFTAVNTCTLLQISTPYGGEWQCVNSRRSSNEKAYHMDATSRKGRQGMVMDVWPDRLEIERREFVLGEAAGPVRIVPIPANPTNPAYGYAAQSARTSAPGFPKGAMVSVVRRKGKNTKKVEEDQIHVSFPSACANGEKGRVLLYEIEALVDGTPVGKWRLAQELHFQPLNRIPTSSELVIGADEIPSYKTVTFRVTPVGFFHRGTPICS